MSQRSVSQFKALYGSTGTTFPDNTTQEISEADMRQFGEDIPDSYYNKTDDAHTLIPQFTTSGTDTYTATPSPAISAYAAGQTFKILFTNANTGAATINLNGVGATAITKDGTTALVADDIKAGSIKILSYDGTRFQIIGDGGVGGAEHFLGVYADDTALTTAHATAEPGDYAFVDPGSGTDAQLYIWDEDDGWVQSGVTSVVPDASEIAKGIAELATQSETNTGTDDARIVTPLKLNTKMRLTRTVTGADSIVQGDDNSLIIFNSGSPFNFTLDQLTASSKISFMNIGAGAVTLIAGSGVTITGSVVIPGAVGTVYPTAFVFYHTATTPRVSISGTESGRVAVAISSGTLTLDINNEIRRDFDLTATETGNFTIAFSNTTNWKESSLTLRLTGTIAITMPSTVRMENFESTAGRWNTSTRVLTLIGVTASPFEILFSPQGSIIECQASDRFV